MSKLDKVTQIVSYAFFASQLVAITIYGGASSIVMFQAGDSTNGLVIGLLVAGMNAAVIGLRLPRYFASRFSSQAFSFFAITFSALALIAAVGEARSYVGLPEPLIASPDVLRLRTTAYLGAACMSIAFVVNVLVAFLAPWRARRDASITSSN